MVDGSQKFGMRIIKHCRYVNTYYYLVVKLNLLIVSTALLTETFHCEQLEARVRVIYLRRWHLQQ